MIRYRDRFVSLQRGRAGERTRLSRLQRTPSLLRGTLLLAAIGLPKLTFEAAQTLELRLRKPRSHSLTRTVLDATRTYANFPGVVARWHYDTRGDVK